MIFFIRQQCRMEFALIAETVDREKF